MVFKAPISLLIFCLVDLSTIESGILKSSTIIILICISPLSSGSIWFIYLGNISDVGYLNIYNC